MSTSPPATIDASLPTDAPPQSVAEQKVWSRLDKIFEYFERLGVASAVGAGGLAVIHFRDKLVPFAAFIPAVIGGLLLLGAFFLLVFGTAASVRAIFGNVGKLALGLATALSLTVSLFFVRAGFYVAAAALNPPAPAAAVAPAQPVQCETTTIMQSEAAPAKAGTAAGSPAR